MQIRPPVAAETQVRGRLSEPSFCRRLQQCGQRARVRHRRKNISDVGLGGRALFAVVCYRLPIALAIGMDKFRQLLAGAHSMDQHFATAEFSENMPVVMGLLSVWYRGFFDTRQFCRRSLLSIAGQVTGFSTATFNGKSGQTVTRDGEPLLVNSGAVIWGTPAPMVSTPTFSCCIRAPV